MDELIRIKTKLFRNHLLDEGHTINEIIAELKNISKIEPYITKIIELDNNDELTLENLTKVRDEIKIEANRIRIYKKKKIIFGIIDEYLKYINSIILNENPDPKFNSVVRSFATELSVKLLYALTNIDDLVTFLTNSYRLDSYIDKELSYEDESKIITGLDRYLIGLNKSIDEEYKSYNALLKEVQKLIRSDNSLAPFINDLEYLANQGELDENNLQLLKEEIEEYINHNSFSGTVLNDENDNRLDFIISNSRLGFNQLNSILRNVKAKEIAPPNLENFRGSMYSSHSNIKYLNHLPNDLKVLINYYTMKFFGQKDIDPKQIDDDIQFDYIDYVLMIRDFSGIEEELTTENSLSEINSERFFMNRYVALQEPTEINYQYVLALSMAAYMVLKDLKQKEYRNNGVLLIDSIDLLFISNVCTKETKKYLDNDKNKKALLIELNEKYPNLLQEINEKLSPCEFDDFIKKLKIEEILYLFNEVNKNPELNTITDLIKFAINFKNKINNFSHLKLDENKFGRINKLFKDLSEVSDITYVGAQLRNWLDTINLHELTPEELNELNKIDPKFVYSQLDYRSQIIYKKCEELQIPFRYYYRRFTNSQIEFLFKIYQGSNVEIPLIFRTLTNLEILKVYEEFKARNNYDNQQAFIYAFNDFTMSLFFKKNDPVRKSKRIFEYIYDTTTLSTDILAKNSGMTYVDATKLKDTYLDADFETIKLLYKACHGDIDRMNDLPIDIILCSSDRLSYLLDKYHNDLSWILRLDRHELYSYPNKAVYSDDVPKFQSIMTSFIRASELAKIIRESEFIKKFREKTIKEFPSLNHAIFHFSKINENCLLNIKFIEDIVGKDDLTYVVRLFSDEDQDYRLTDELRISNGNFIINNQPFTIKKKYTFSTALLTSYSTFINIYHNINGDFVNRPEETAKKMRNIIKYVSRVNGYKTLSAIAIRIFGTPIELFKEEDYKKFLTLPDYILNSNLRYLDRNIEMYRFELQLASIPKREGVKLLNPEEVRLSYDRLVSFMGSEEEIKLEPLLYIDYSDIAHLVYTYYLLPEDQQSFIPKQTVLAIINYIASTNYKIDVHTFDTMEFIKLSFQELSRLTQQNQESSNKRSTL